MSNRQVSVSVVLVALNFLMSTAVVGESDKVCSPHRGQGRGVSGAPLFMRVLLAVLPWALHHRHSVRVPVQVSGTPSRYLLHSWFYASSQLILNLPESQFLGVELPARGGGPDDTYSLMLICNSVLLTRS